MKAFYSLLIVLFFFTTAAAQTLYVNWTRFIGPDSCCVGLTDAIPSKDGGIVFTGWTDFTGSGDIPYFSVGGAVVGKVDSNHNLLWAHAYGGDHGKSICQTSDGGYAILAYTGDIGMPDGYISGYKGGGDIWLFKIDSTGNFLWGNCFGSDTGDEQALSIATTKDNGFILLGISNWYGQDVPYHLGGSEFEYDWFVVKTDSTGHKQWSTDLGGSNDESPNSMGCILSADNCFYLVSSTNSADVNCTDTIWHAGVNTFDDYYVIKVDTTGHVLWDKSFGGSGYDEVASAAFDPRDSSVVITGSSTSNDFMVTGNTSGNGMWTIKVDRNGDLVWQKILGTSSGCVGSCVAVNRDTGYVLLGTTGE